MFWEKIQESFGKILKLHLTHDAIKTLGRFRLNVFLNWFLIPSPGADRNLIQLDLGNLRSGVQQARRSGVQCSACVAPHMIGAIKSCTTLSWGQRSGEVCVLAAMTEKLCVVLYNPAHHAFEVHKVRAVTWIVRTTVCVQVLEMLERTWNSFVLFQGFEIHEKLYFFG